MKLFIIIAVTLPQTVDTDLLMENYIAMTKSSALMVKSFSLNKLHDFLEDKDKAEFIVEKLRILMVFDMSST